MSMMMRRGGATGQGFDTGPLDATGDIRFPETATAAATPWPSAEIRARVEATAGQRFTGYLGVRRLPNVGAPDGLLLFYAGQLIAARFGGADGCGEIFRGRLFERGLERAQGFGDAFAFQMFGHGAALR